MKKIKKPEIIEIPIGALEEIKLRINSAALLEEDKRIVLVVLDSYSWLMKQLQSTKCTIHRLKKMFGFNTEKHKKGSSKNSAPSDFSSEGTTAKQILSLDALQGLTQEGGVKK
jgi:hypothetical protein